MFGGEGCNDDLIAKEILRILYKGDESFEASPPPTDDKHSSQNFFDFAKTTWGGNILLGQDCLLKI